MVDVTNVFILDILTIGVMVTKFPFSMETEQDVH